jgi:hypothetical protein
MTFSELPTGVWFWFARNTGIRSFDSDDTAGPWVKISPRRYQPPVNHCPPGVAPPIHKVGTTAVCVMLNAPQRCY